MKKATFTFLALIAAATGSYAQKAQKSTPKKENTVKVYPVPANKLDPEHWEAQLQNIIERFYDPNEPEDNQDLANFQNNLVRTAIVQQTTDEHGLPVFKLLDAQRNNVAMITQRHIPGKNATDTLTTKYQFDENSFVEWKKINQPNSKMRTSGPEVWLTIHKLDN